MEIKDDQNISVKYVFGDIMSPNVHSGLNIVMAFNIIMIYVNYLEIVTTITTTTTTVGSSLAVVATLL